jgi:hypothetical protein
VIDVHGREWLVMAERFDFGRLWGVAIESAEAIDGRTRRLGARAPAGLLFEKDAIARVLPELRKWADSEGWKKGRPTAACPSCLQPI